MGKKKHPEHVNHERWLVSYADFITLLFAFFVVLFASGQSDKAKQKKVAAAMQAAFTQMAMFDPHSATPALTDASAGPTAAPTPLALPVATAGSGDAPHEAEEAAPGKSVDPLTPELLRERVQKIVEEQVANGGLKADQARLRATPEGMTLSLQEGGFFDSGSAELRAAAIPALMALAKCLPGTPMRVEGHTDNVPMHTAAYASNWELSSARAAAIARFLLEHSAVNPALVSVAGYAEFHPVVSNATAEGRARNRRVDVVFLESPGSSTQDAGVRFRTSPSP